MKQLMVKCDKCGNLYELEENSICNFLRDMQEPATLIAYDLCNTCVTELMDIVDHYVAGNVSETKPGRKRKASEDDRDIMVKMRKEGLTYKDIAKKMGLAESYVFKIIKEKEQLTKNANIEDEGKLMALWKAGRSIEWIADEFGTSEEKVSKKIKELIQQ